MMTRGYRPPAAITSRCPSILWERRIASAPGVGSLTPQMQRCRRANNEQDAPVDRDHRDRVGIRDRVRRHWKRPERHGGEWKRVAECLAQQTQCAVAPLKPDALQNRAALVNRSPNASSATNSP